MFRSQFEVDVKNILNELGIGWKYEKQLRIGERCLLPDFTITTNDYFSNFVSNNVNKTILLEVTGASYKRWRQGFLKRLDYIVEHDKEDKYRIFVVTYPDVYHFFSFLENKYNGKVHVFSFGKPNIKKHERYIEIEDITNIDYSHFLPWHNKCGKIHGHSSKVSVKIGGILGLESKPWLIDFGKAKQIVKDICNSYDHKLLVDRNSVSSLKEKENVFEVTYLMKDGSEYFFKLPSHTIKVLNNSSTAENLSMNIAEEIGNNLPDNLYYVEVKLNEGFDNTSQATFVKQGPEERMFGNYDFIKCLKYHLVY
jgi:6-pyruvoyltetrahydropterin/6-carboxytetrahydropterin synthase